MPTRLQQSRRRLLTAIGAGGACVAGRVLPERWTRPAVDTVSLPAHAQTSGTYFGMAMSQFTDAAPAVRGILDLAIPAADAQLFAVYVCVTPSGDSAEVELTLLGVLGAPARAAGMVPIGGSKTTLSIVEVAEACAIKKVTIEVRLDTLAAGKIFIDDTVSVFNFDVPLAECSMPPLLSCKMNGP